MSNEGEKAYVLKKFEVGVELCGVFVNLDGCIHLLIYCKNLHFSGM